MTFHIGDHLDRESVVFGCGNPLFGDDGFGPAVIEYLCEHYAVPPYAACLDAGTSVRDFLFDILLSPQKPRQIIIVDAMNVPGVAPGEIREISIDAMQSNKTCDFSLHQFPTTNMLKEIQEYTDVRVRVLVVTPTELPQEVSPGLSPSVRKAISPMCGLIIKVLNELPPLKNGDTP